MGVAGRGKLTDISSTNHIASLTHYKWAGWVLDEEESLKHFEAAYKMGINTWD